MKFTHMMFIMFISSFLIQYFLMPSIMVNSRVDITNNYGKVYISIIMGLFMVLVEVMSKDHQYKVFNWKLYIFLAIFLTLFIYLYRKQVAINDKQYLEEMIEHHSMGILMSKRIVEKTDSYNITKIAKDIIQTQEDEIKQMRGFVSDIESKGAKR